MNEKAQNLDLRWSQPLYVLVAWNFVCTYFVNNVGHRRNSASIIEVEWGIAMNDYEWRRFRL